MFTKAEQAQIAAIVAQCLAAQHDGTEQAAQTEAAPPAPADGKIYRSKPGKEAAKAACAELAVKYDLKVAGGSRTFKSLSAKEQAAYRAESDAIWAAVPKTRTTKA